MFYNKYLIPSILILVLVAILNWIGGVYDLYYVTNWYDWVVHFLGGVWVALFFLWLSLWFKRPISGKVLFLGVFLVGVAWEIYELSFGLISFRERGYIWNTSHDLLMDLVGALVVIYFTKNKK